MSTILTCGCSVQLDEDYSENPYCATWENIRVFANGERIKETCYGSLCDKHLVSYNGKRCKIGGGELDGN